MTGIREYFGRNGMSKAVLGLVAIDRGGRHAGSAGAGVKCAGSRYVQPVLFTA